MSLPTLLLKGYIVPQSYTNNKEKENLKNMTGIEYILKIIDSKIPEIGSIYPKKKANKFGDNVFVIKSGTGTGKSTVIPPYLYESFIERFRRNIAITQPRILTAKVIAEETPKNYDFMKLGDNLGYNTGDIKIIPTSKGVIYMTVGTLLAQLNSTEDEEFINLYGIIIIDEVHDRSIDVDMCLYKIKKLLINNYENPLCPIVFLMSATFNPKIFMDYYECPETNYIEFTGMTYHINSIFPKYDIPNYIDYINETITNIHTSNISDIINNDLYRDIIVFIPGEGKIKKIIKYINNYNSSVDENYLACITLTSTSFNYAGLDYINIFSSIAEIKYPKYKIIDGIISDEIDKYIIPSRRIIIATPVAETGITLETLKYCIDSGYYNSVTFNPNIGSTVKFIKNVTVGMANQRKGRVGRKSIGNWYPCYTEATFSELDKDQFAEIVTKDISIHLLNIIITETETKILLKKDLAFNEINTLDKSLKINKFSDRDDYLLKSKYSLNLSLLDLVELPSANSLTYSLEKLYNLGFINSDYNPTILGLYVKKFSKLSLEYIKLIFSAYSYGANVLDIITIISFLMVGNQGIFINKYKPINTLFPKVSNDDFLFYYKNIIGDQFVEFVLIWDLYSSFLDNFFTKLTKKLDLNNKYELKTDDIIKWCDKNKIHYEGLINVSIIRDEIIINLVSIGFDPFYNSLNLAKGKYNLRNILLANLQDGIGEIKKIKNCIANVYQLNSLIYDDTLQSYVSEYKKIPVNIQDNNLISTVDINHKKIFTSNISLQKNIADDDFSLVGEVISIAL